MNDSTVQFFDAVQHGNVSFIEGFLQSGQSLAITNDDGQSPLHIAAREGHVETLRMLLNNGLDGTQVDRQGQTLLHTAALAGSDSRVAAFLYHRDQSLLTELLDSRDDITNRPCDLVDDDGRTLLHHAVIDSDMSLVRFLAAYFDCSMVDQYELAPLWYALDNESIEIATLLNQHGASHHLHHPDTNQTALHYSAERGNVKTIQWLLRHSHEIDSQDERGWTALFWACYGGNQATIECLIGHGANIHILSGNGQTIAHAAASHGQAQSLVAIGRLDESLLTRADSSGTTPINLLAPNGHVGGDNSDAFGLLSSLVRGLKFETAMKPWIHSVQNNQTQNQTAPQLMSLIFMIPLFKLRRDSSLTIYLNHFFVLYGMPPEFSNHVTLLFSQDNELFYQAMNLCKRFIDIATLHTIINRCVVDAYVTHRPTTSEPHPSAALELIRRQWPNSFTFFDQFMYLKNFYQEHDLAYEGPPLQLLRELNWMNRALMQSTSHLFRLPAEVIERIIHFLIILHCGRYTTNYR